MRKSATFSAPRSPSLSHVGEQISPSPSLSHAAELHLVAATKDDEMLPTTTAAAGAEPMATAAGADVASVVGRDPRVRQRVASALHEIWRNGRRLETGTIEPRWKPCEGGGKIDIAACDFAALPSEWQASNLHAAHVVCQFVERGYAERVDVLSDEFVERASEHQHIDWMKENPWCTDPLQMIPYARLTYAEKEKDRNIIRIALHEMENYFRRLFIVGKCEEHGLVFDDFTRDMALLVRDLRNSESLAPNDDILDLNGDDILQMISKGGALGSADKPMSPGALASRRLQRRTLTSVLQTVNKVRRASTSVKRSIKKRRSQRRQSSIIHHGSTKIAGMLLKLGSNGKWQPRYFVAHGHYLMYRKSMRGNKGFEGGVDLLGKVSHIEMLDEQTLRVVGLTAQQTIPGGGEREARTLDLRTAKATTQAGVYEPNIEMWYATLLNDQANLRLDAMVATQAMKATTEKALREAGVDSLHSDRRRSAATLEQMNANKNILCKVAVSLERAQLGRAWRSWKSMLRAHDMMQIFMKLERHGLSVGFRTWVVKDRFVRDLSNGLRIMAKKEVRITKLALQRWRRWVGDVTTEQFAALQAELRQKRDEAAEVERVQDAAANAGECSRTCTPTGGAPKFTRDCQLPGMHNSERTSCLLS